MDPCRCVEILICSRIGWMPHLTTCVRACTGTGIAGMDRVGNKYQYSSRRQQAKRLESLYCSASLNSSAVARLNPSNASTLKSHLMFQAEPIRWMPVLNFSLRAATEVAPARRVPFCGVPLTVCQPGASTDGQGTAPPSCTL